MEFNDLAKRAARIRELYAEWEKERYGRSWTREEIALGFMGDVGDLMKLVLAQSGVRHIENADQKLAHELADCLWSILILSQKYDIDLEQAFLHTMDELEESLTHRATQQKRES